MMSFGYNSLWGLMILIGDVWAILNILQSAASNEKNSFGSSLLCCCLSSA
jgi:hypothetical protein